MNKTESSIEKNALFRTLDALQRGILVFDSNRRLIYANPSARTIIPVEVPVGHILPDVIPNTRVRRSDGSPMPHEEIPLSRAFRGENVVSELLQIIESDGSLRWICVSAHPVYEEGALAYVLAIYEDVSDRKSRDDKLTFMVESAKILSLQEDLRARLIQKAKLAVPSLADWCAIDILNEDGTVERLAVINTDPEQLRLIEYLQQKYPPDPKAPTSPKNVIATMQAQFIPLVTDEMVTAQIHDPEQREEVLKLQLKSVMAIPIVSRGRGLGCLTLAYAKSGRVYSEADFEFFKEYCAHVSIALENNRLFQELQRRDNAKDLFLASLSHELRNPLAPIKSSLELLKMKRLDSETESEIKDIEHQFNHLSKLLNDLLDVTRFTQATISIDPHPIDVRPVVERSLKATDALMRTADITLHFTYPSGRVMVNADDTRLEQAIINLVNNAIKYTPAGGSIWVEIGEERVNDHELAVIRVRDNGTGIAAEDLPNIFEMYYQGRKRMHMSSGLGIGLLLVDKIIQLHGGSIEARSEGLGKGSEFVIRLPAASESSKQNADPLPDPATISGKRVLVVDDNEAAANALRKLLNKLGATADTAYSGRETLKKDLSQFDIMLLDIGMPQMDGYEVVRTLRERGNETPIVALTGYGLSEDRERAIAAGFSAHLTKPVGIDDIARVVTEVLS